MTDSWLRAGAFVVGLLLVLAFLQSVLRVAIVNRQRGDRLARTIGHVVYTAVAGLARRRRGYDKVQDALAWVLPIYILALIGFWFLLVQAGFSLLIWSLQAEHSLLQATIASGSALSTLGFLTPPDISGQLLAIPEGAFGLGIVVFFFTFIPGYQTTIQQREVKVAWLYARCGADPTAAGFIEWLQRSGKARDMTEIWEDWETWFRLLIETHTLAPVVSFVPSVHRGQSWLVAATIVLDSASFWLSALDDEAQSAAAMCHATGVRALRLVAAQHRIRDVRDATGSRRCGFDRAAVEETRERLAALGVPVRADADASWQGFAALCGEYEVFLEQLAAILLVPIGGGMDGG
jgi:hypothetical protein